jgi:mono/diheme cytochrome c family protein
MRPRQKIRIVCAIIQPGKAMRKTLRAWLTALTPTLLWVCAHALGLILIAGVAAPHGKKDWPAPEEAKKLKNPVAPSEASLNAGKTLFAEKCTPCHGEAGKGDGPLAVMYDVKPADLSDARMMGEMTEGEIFWKISEDRPPMPAFKKQLS